MGLAVEECNMDIVENAICRPPVCGKLFWVECGESPTV